ncbi:hypothetical protein [uncultured Neptuniibacter sp.]|uniref:hypothetical protein n=1 Tax=uncultured Neptuniibacter sp. TaxID=502143 RepID=UPI002620B984|nr:hypothetical protein [uncultured Neptuniibacter sp.]
MSSRSLIHSIEVVNDSGDTLDSLTIVVPKTHSQVVCKQVAPGGFCSNSFPPRPFRNNVATIVWRVAGQEWQQTFGADQLDLSSSPTVFGVRVDVGKGGHLSVQVAP